METHGRNEGFHILEDFACEAVSEAPSVSVGPRGRGLNTDMHVVTELVSDTSQPPVSAERIAELRKSSIHELLTLIRTSGSNLSGQELLVIHDIAAERLNEHGSSERAFDLSREAMLVAVNRGA